MEKALLREELMQYKTEKQFLVAQSHFRKEREGLEHQIKMPKIQGPEKLKSDLQLRKDLKSKIPKDYLPMWLQREEIETRQVEPVDLLRAEKLPPYRSTWMKPTGKLPSDERIHQALLLYVSDMGLLGVLILMR